MINFRGKRNKFDIFVCLVNRQINKVTNRIGSLNSWGRHDNSHSELLPLSERSPSHRRDQNVVEYHSTFQDVHFVPAVYGTFYPCVIYKKTLKH